MLGIVGEYLGKLMLNVNKTPQYVIRDKENVSETADNKEEEKQGNKE